MTRAAKLTTRARSEPATYLEAQPELPGPEIARQLAGQLAHDHRLAFASSFVHAIVGAHLRACGIPEFRPPDELLLLPLQHEASTTATRLGHAAAELSPREAAYFIGTIYTATLPEAYRSAYGVFYTPPSLAERLLTMAEEAGTSWNASRVLDPACGGGAFLVPIALRMVAAMEGTEPAFALQQLAARLRGYDIDPFGGWLAQAMLHVALRDVVARAGRPLPQIIESRDSLDLRSEEADSYDLVIGNPPYGRISLENGNRAVFQRSIYGHANLYGIFTDAALRWTKTGGVIAFVTPTSMLSGLYYKALRHLIAFEAPPLAVDFVTERDGVFEDVLQETMLTTYRKGGLAIGGKVGFIAIDSEGRASQKKAGEFSLPAKPDAPWLLPRVPAQAKLTRRLRSMRYRLSDYGYGVSTGPLVWNRHKEQFRATPTEGAFPVIWAEAVTSAGRFLWRSDRRNHAPWFLAKRPKDDWLIVTRPCVLLQRTTAKEQARRLIAAELPESFIRRHQGIVIENHLNMVRATTERPSVPASVIAALFNSAAVDAAFRCINGSVAVSAFELEQLPLPAPPIMARLAQLISSGAPAIKIEAMIATAYGERNAATAA